MKILDKIISKVFMKILDRLSQGIRGTTGYPGSGYVPTGKIIIISIITLFFNCAPSS